MRVVASVSIGFLALRSREDESELFGRPAGENPSKLGDHGSRDDVQVDDHENGVGPDVERGAGIDPIEKRRRVDEDELGPIPHVVEEIGEQVALEERAGICCECPGRKNVEPLFSRGGGDSPSDVAQEVRAPLSDAALGSREQLVGRSSRRPSANCLRSVDTLVRRVGRPKRNRRQRIFEPHVSEQDLRDSGPPKVERAVESGPTKIEIHQGDAPS